MNRSRYPLYIAAFVASLSPAYAAERSQQFNVPAGRLSNALTVFAQQAGISLAANDPGLRNARTDGLRGNYTVRQGLAILLRGSGYSFQFIDSATVRIVKASLPPKPKPQKPVKPVKPPPPLVEQQVEPIIVVTASKREGNLADYPASVDVIDFSTGETARQGARGSEMLLQRLPALSSTNLGAGRNKIFIRGIADSSFNGPSQATISQYLGDVRLIYSAPDPNLSLYDIKRVEVLEGPQGTLYGAGSLGGIIRLVPNAPDSSRFAGAATAGVQVTRSGGVGGDGALMLNVPVAADRAALRVVGYHSITPGYIDDSFRGLKDVNRNNISGLRASFRLQPGNDWTIDLGAMGQNIGARDSQYAEKNAPPLSRRSALSQPFDNDYRLGTLTLSKRWSSMNLVSATGYAHHDIDSVFDATTAIGATTPMRFSEQLKVSLWSHESRLSGKFASGQSWVAGISLLDNRNLISRHLGPIGAETQIAGVTNSFFDAAAFGEATFGLTGRLATTVGGRLAYVRQTSELTGTAATNSAEPVKSLVRFLPTVALSWKPGRSWLIFARYQEGFRPGGLQVTSTAANRFSTDEISTAEAGVRFGQNGHSPWSGGLTLSRTRWSDIQADLVDVQGFPFTANIGSGRVLNAEANIVWKPSDAFSLEAAGFINSSDLTDPAPMFVAAQDRDLPNIADSGWRFAGRYSAVLSPKYRLSLDAMGRYVGSSTLAIGAPFDLHQGSYWEVNAGARLSSETWGLSLDIQNLLDARGNRFSFGNPFSVTTGNQITPQRPRTFRIGLDAQF